VNAVCSQLLQRYCFELGLAPEQTVLAEVQSRQMLRKAIDAVLQPEQRAALVYYGRRFSLEPGEWDTPVRLVVDYARSNGIREEALREMGLANAKGMLSNWPNPRADGGALTAALAEVLARTHEEVRAFVEKAVAAGGKGPTQVALKGLERLRECRAAVAEGRWSWSQWAALAELNAGAPLRPVVAPLMKVASAHEEHPEFHGDVTKYLTLVFELAATALAHYRDAKQEAGALDFVDMEMLFLHALHSSAAVRASLTEELDLVLVDEFQDTSPIQLAVFVELAKLAKRSVWVGDPKQAIYGFRGTDAGLIASVIQAIPGWGGRLGAPLTNSRRSVPSLVGLMNQIFTPAFPTLARQDVQLTPVRSEHPNQASLITWTFDSPNIDTYFQGLGVAIAQLLNSGLQVNDAVTGEWRAAAPGDIAVLCQYNRHPPAVAAALHRWGIPCVSTRPGLLATPEASLVVACLRRMHDPLDTAATALIVSLVDSIPAQAWLDDRLRYVQSGAEPSRWKAEGPQAHRLVVRLESLRPRLAALTPAEALRLASAESGVCRAGAHWSSNPEEAAARTANVEAMVAMAVTYEDDCRSSRRPATVAGLLQWLAVQQKEALDSRAAASGDAVEVSTHHSAKGLEWPIVVVTGLDVSVPATHLSWCR
jgi:superfamily I DNA/RNA helicase